MARRVLPGWMPAVLALTGLATSAAEAQVTHTCGTTALGTYRWTASGQVTKPNNCFGASGFRCHPVENAAWFVEKTNPACDPTAGSCAVSGRERTSGS